jgi:hypothetical protein
MTLPSTTRKAGALKGAYLRCVRKYGKAKAGLQDNQLIYMLLLHACHIISQTTIVNLHG